MNDGKPTVAVHIGNTDRRLTHPQWVKFRNDTADVVNRLVAVYSDHGARLIGVWYAASNSTFRSAVFIAQLPADTSGAGTELVADLRDLAAKYGQDSIACQWSPGTEFLPPADPRPGS